jgi:SCP-2 sterol transfer family
VRYLSPEWIDAAGRAVADDEELQSRTAGIRLTIEYVVTGAKETGAPDDTVRWHVVIDDGGVRLAHGGAVQPDLRFTTDYGTAAGVAEGKLGAQRAFVEGRVRVGGDLSLLIRHHRALSTVDDALAGVRSETIYR